MLLFLGYTSTILLVSLITIIKCEYMCRIPVKNDFSFSSRSATRSTRSYRSSNLKIIPEYSTELKANVAFEDIKNKIILPSFQYWERTLTTRMASSDNIRISRTCVLHQRAYYRFSDGTNKTSCVLGCEAETKCYNKSVPEKYLDSCNQVINGRPVNVGSPNGGISSNSLLLFVDSTRDNMCTSGSTFAYSGICQLESVTDRPILGYINFCPNHLTLNPLEIATMVGMTKHEIAHVLGFSPNIFAFLRDDNGNPRTPRNPTTGLPSLGFDKYRNYLSSTSTIETQSILWQSSITSVKWSYQMLTLPNVVAYAREHFGCHSLNGMPLENAGDLGTHSSHFEERFSENELMSARISNRMAVSKLTLSFFKDTGWYDVNMTMADPWDWGKGLGCDFLFESCYAYMESQKARNLATTPYCSGISPTVRCAKMNSSHKCCDITRFSTKLAPQYQYFTSLTGIDANQLPYYGGSSALSEYCPTMRACDTGKSSCGTGESSASSIISYKPVTNIFVLVIICSTWFAADFAP